MVTRRRASAIDSTIASPTARPRRNQAACISRSSRASVWVAAFERGQQVDQHLNEDVGIRPTSERLDVHEDDVRAGLLTLDLSEKGRRADAATPEDELVTTSGGLFKNVRARLHEPLRRPPVGSASLCERG
jgi:hypothetical protein